MSDPCVHLQVCQDGVWAHFHVPGGVYWMTNLSVQGRMASLFGSQYRDWVAQRPVPEPTFYLDTFDENDLCDAWMGLPVEFFHPGPDFT